MAHNAYDPKLAKEAEALYPKLAAKADQLHHITPKYLGGAAVGPLVKLPAAYHQLITNAFRSEWAYGQGKPSAAQLQQIMATVKAKLPW